MIQKKNLGISDKEYKIFTKEFDEIAKAESLETAEEIQKLRKLDQQLTSFQDLIQNSEQITKTINGKTNRSGNLILKKDY